MTEKLVKTKEIKKMKKRFDELNIDAVFYYFGMAFRKINSEEAQEVGHDFTTKFFGPSTIVICYIER